MRIFFYLHFQCWRNDCLGTDAAWPLWQSSELRRRHIPKSFIHDRAVLKSDLFLFSFWFFPEEKVLPNCLPLIENQSRDTPWSLNPSVEKLLSTKQGLPQVAFSSQITRITIFCVSGNGFHNPRLGIVNSLITLQVVGQAFFFVGKILAASPRRGLGYIPLSLRSMLAKLPLLSVICWTSGNNFSVGGREQQYVAATLKLIKTN